MSDLFHLSLHPLDFVLRAVLVYLWILILLRLSGKRQIGQMGATEFVTILLISNAVQNAMNGGDNSLIGGLILATTLIVLSGSISILTFKSRRFKMIFEGRPTLLVHKGHLIEPHLIQERITHQELRDLLRRQGIHSLEEIDTAILEPNGILTITKKSEIKP